MNERMIIPERGSGIDNIIFDLDGTLVDSADDIIDCLSRAYAAVSIPCTTKIDKSFIGPPLQNIIHSVSPALDSRDVGKIITHFRACYDTSNLAKTRFKKKALETLHFFKALNKKLFIVTNKPITPTKIILKNLNIAFFCDIITPDIQAGFTFSKSEMVFFLKQKWKLNVAATLMVGDTASDVYAAREHGIISAIVLNGYGDRESIQKSKPEYLINSLDKLEKIIF